MNKDNRHIISDPLWNELEELIKSFLDGRITSIDNNGRIALCELATQEVTFTYRAPLTVIPDKKLDGFVKCIMLSLRDEQ